MVSSFAHASFCPYAYYCTWTDWTGVEHSAREVTFHSYLNFGDGQFPITRITRHWRRDYSSERRAARTARRMGASGARFFVQISQWGMPWARNISPRETVPVPFLPPGCKMWFPTRR